MFLRGCDHRMYLCHHAGPRLTNSRPLNGSVVSESQEKGVVFEQKNLEKECAEEEETSLRAISFATCEQLCCK